MTKTWAEEQKKTVSEKYRVFCEDTVREINANPDWTDGDKNKIIELLRNKASGESFDGFLINALAILQKNPEDEKEWLRALSFLCDLEIKMNEFQMDMKAWLDRLNDFIDSEKIELDGDIIITDPCYVMRDEDDISDDDWRWCDYGKNMQILGFKKYLSANTIYGDWSCITIDSDTGEVMGTFCADAGMVGVFLFDDVLRYNPKFNKHIVYPQAVTVIRNFKGTVQIVIDYTEGTYKENSVCHKAGEKWENYSVHVIGKGIDSTTGETVNFETMRHGL